MIKNPERKGHWEKVYRQTSADQTSWHQDVPQLSLAMIARADLDFSTPIIDIGGGASLLVDHLLERGYSDLTILDISAAALEQGKARLGNRAGCLSGWGRRSPGSARSGSSAYGMIGLPSIF